MSDNRVPDDRDNQDDTEGRQNQQGTNMALGMAIGVALGAGIGVALDNLALGIGVGIALGAAVGATGIIRSS